MDLTGQQIGHQGLSHLLKLKNLKSLSLQGTKAHDKAIALLTAYPNLQHLNVSNTKVSDAGLDTIGRLTNVAKLNLSSTLVTDEGLSKLTRLNKLQEFQTGNTKISRPAKFFFLRDTLKLAAETILAIEHVRLKEKDGKIDRAYFTGTSKEYMTDEHLLLLGQIPSLESIHICNQKQITGIGFKCFGDLPKLNKLYMYACDGITADGIKAIASSRSLESLSFSQQKSQFNVTDLKPLSQIKTLQTLKVPFDLKTKVADLEIMMPDCIIR